ncbi:hypothetical protein DSO57_1039335 [Entomophthora muscae]|uniref:Uncharacterized protein n=1 Tax=Entomophthora muscae TaxID=34485 RepID=A0ACC2SYH6_9FUNG|nr:hypothetical protein DSO57_1039335 [Entomophthora muscae]
MPDTMKNNLLEGELHILGDFKVGPSDFINIKASNLTIERASSNLTFNMNPKEILINNSTIENIIGLDGAKLKQLQLLNCQVTSFSLLNVKSLSFLQVQGFKGDIRALLPNLKYVDSAVFRNIFQDSITLGIAMVTNFLEITGNWDVETVFLPNLRKAGLIYIHDNYIPMYFKAPLLESSEMKLSSHIISLDIPKTLMWSGKSLFNANNFCQDYSSLFREKGLQFETLIDCLPFCYSNVTVTTDNLRLLRKCAEIGGTLTIDKNSPADIYLFRLSSVDSLVISEYYGLFNAPSSTTY